MQKHYLIVNGRREKRRNKNSHMISQIKKI